MEMDSEIDESIDMANDTTVKETSFNWAVISGMRSRTWSMLGVFRVRRFDSVVDSTIRSSTASNLGASRVRSFASVVDSTIRSSTASNTGASGVRSFDSVVDNTIRSSTASNFGASRVRSFDSVVDNTIRSSTASNFGASRVRSFDSVVDNTIRSSTASNFGASRVRSFASVIDNTIRSSTASNLETSPVHRFGSAVNVRTAATRLSQVRSKLKRHVDGIQLFSMYEILCATNYFSTVNKICDGSFGVVYRGHLAGCRQVAIKRVETGSKMEFQQKECVFVSELVLSDLHHRHLIRLVGFCENGDTKFLVYEYMKNGALYDHLHDKNNVEKSSSVLNNWKIRIKIALDASRGIEYLHDDAVPSIIHRNIKSKTILLDATWTARVSGFGLSLMSPEGPEPDRQYNDMSMGTAGYIDPEYYKQSVLTAKSDVYGFGVVPLQLLTGKRAILTYGDGGGTPLCVVDFAVPAILGGELVKILDPRVGPPDVNEAEAVELVAYTALHCVNLEGKDRPTIADIVLNLERALAICNSN